jgi:DNA mismatch repair protein MutL
VSRIRELPPEVINQIAAGEVVERPASVVKELVENSIDADADRISIAIEEGGRTGIVVTDNGKGIDPDDLPLAFQRHATSKIVGFEDLFRIRSMGFRGEALSSIASVADINLRTFRRPDGPGGEYRIGPGLEPVQNEWVGPHGTVIEVRNLFRTLPVRFKFLKSPATEQSQIYETLAHIALGHPEIQFQLSTQNRVLLSLTKRESAKLRLLDLYPSIDENDLHTVVLESDDFKLKAEVLRPDRSRRDRQYQHIFLNRRWIRHPPFLQAIVQGASGYIQKDVYPGVWIWIDIDPGRVDINVHPTKKEVRFLEPDRLFPLVRRAVNEAFEYFQKDKTRFGSLIERDSEDASGEELRSGWHAPGAPLRVSEGGGTRYDTRQSGLFSQKRDEISPFAKTNLRDIPDVLRSLPPSPFPHRESIPSEITFLAQVYQTFLLFLFDGELVLVDQHTAHERIRYDAFRKEFGEGRILSSSFLFPHTLRMTTLEVSRIESRLEELAHLGFDLDIQGPETIKVSGIPAMLEGEDPASLLQELSETSQQFELPLVRSDRLDETLMTLACHSSLRANRELPDEDGERLVRILMKTEYPFSCPHGRPTILHASRQLVEKWFHRT